MGRRLGRGASEVVGGTAYEWEAEVWLLLQGAELNRRMRSGFRGLWKTLGTQGQEDPESKGAPDLRLGNMREWNNTAAGRGKRQHVPCPGCL